MSDEIEMLHATLDLMDEAVVLLDLHSAVLFWSKSAATLTGYDSAEVLSQLCPDGLFLVDEKHRRQASAALDARTAAPGCAEASGRPIAAYTAAAKTPDVPAEAAFVNRPTLASLHHRLGHSVPAMLRKLPLFNSLNICVGSALLFYPVEDVSTLPHGNVGEGANVEHSQADMEDRLEAAHHQFTSHQASLGLLWITVDQAAQLRKTHGREACESMLRIVEQTLLRGLHPSEVIGRWGNDEFLILSHQHTASLLIEHAQRIVGLARTADFRWWGDRVNLTISAGVAQALDPDTLNALLHRARQAMQASLYAGGNRVTDPRGHSCLQS